MGLSFFGLLFIGIPVGIALASAGLFFGYLGFGMTLFNLAASAIGREFHKLNLNSLKFIGKRRQPIPAPFPIQ